MGKEILLLLVMFWNLENFFDPFISTPKDSTNGFFREMTSSQIAAEQAFTPAGEKFWTWKKFAQKRDNIAKTIALVKEQFGLFPAIIGVCEVENYFVLKQLAQNSILAPLDYGIIHKDSPDRRGIDAALLYRKSEFRPVDVNFYPIKIKKESVGIESNIADSLNAPQDSVLNSRLLVYAKGVFKGLDTLHFLVTHWPSKLGGEKLSFHRRMAASNLVGRVTDSILNADPKANIVVMGDFNDNATSLAMRKLDNLVNMSLMGDKRQYTYKYKESWSRIDHFLISPNLLDDMEQDNTKQDAAVWSDGSLKWLFCTPSGSIVFRHGFLLEKDALYLGEKVRRTLIGPRYNGGTSDHLPILLKIYGYDF